MKIKCENCGIPFETNKSWTKYCNKIKCKKSANNKRQKNYRMRHKNNPFSVKSFDELRNKEPYKSHIEMIINTINDLEKSGEKITWDKLRKITKFSYETLGYYIKKLRDEKIIDKNSLKIKDKLEPLRIYYKYFIETSSEKNIFNSRNLFLFNKKLSQKDLKKHEEVEIHKSINKLQEEYFKFCNCIWSIGLRKAGELWDEFIRKNKIDDNIKMYFWLEIIRIHYLATDRPHLISGNYYYYYYRKENIYPISKVNINDLKIHQYEKTSFPWSEKFTRLIRKASKRYYDKKIKDYYKEFMDLCHKTFNERLKVNEFITVLSPELISYSELSEKFPRELSHKMKNLLAFDEFKNKSIKNVNEIEEVFQISINPLKEKEIFNKLEKEIIDLGFEDKNQFYDELRYLTDTFTCP